MTKITSFSMFLVLSLLAGGAAPAHAQGKQRIVFLMHGWNGNAESFGGLGAQLRSAQPGFWQEGHWTVVPIGFTPPHENATLPEQVEVCAETILDQAARASAQAPGLEREVYFITHSMGGLIIRHLYLLHPPGDTGLGRVMRDLRKVIMVSPPNQGSDEVLYALTQLNQQMSSSFIASILSERMLKSLTNAVLERFLAGVPLEQARNMASGSDYIRNLNLRWHGSGSCETFPAWILGGAHDNVVDLANANLNLCHVSMSAGDGMGCFCCRIPQDRVRFYPFNHSNTNRRDGILGSIDGPNHPVFQDIARILTDQPLPPPGDYKGPSKIFLKLRHPAPDRLAKVLIEPFGDLLESSPQYLTALSEGKVTGMRQGEFVVIAGDVASLFPVPGNTVLTLRVEADRSSILPGALSILPGVDSKVQEYGPPDLIKKDRIKYRPVQIILSREMLSSNSVLSVEVNLSQAPEESAFFIPFVASSCGPEAMDPAALEQAEREMAGKDSVEMVRFLRKVGSSHDPRFLGTLGRFADSTSPAPLRRSALAAIGDLGVPGALDPLRQAVGDPDPQIWMVALDAMGRVPSHDAVSELVAMLAEPGDRERQRVALFSLMQVSPRKLLPALEAALSEAPSTLRRSRVTALTLASPEGTLELVGFVARQALAGAAGGGVAARYQRVLDMLFAHLTPDDRNHIRQTRKRLGETGELQWSGVLLQELAKRRAAPRSNGGTAARHPAPPSESAAPAPAQPVITGSMSDVKQQLQEEEDVQFAPGTEIPAGEEVPAGEDVPSGEAPDETAPPASPAPEQGRGGIGYHPRPAAAGASATPEAPAPPVSDIPEIEP